MRLFSVLLLCFVCAAQPRYEILLKGGHVIDPKNAIDGRMDVALRDGKVAAVARDIPAADAAKVIDAAGLYVTPGLIDLHVHVFSNTGFPDAWAGDSSVQPDAFSFRTGCTTMVDAGSAGWRNFEPFLYTVVERAQTRVLALINIAGLGMITDVTEQDPADFNPGEVARLARKHKGVVVGVKSAHYQRPDWLSIQRAIEAGKTAGIPIMVDFGYFLPERPYWQMVTEVLRPGDMSTHCFRGPVPWVDESGKLYPYLRAARERGVKFDVGHGGGSFVFRNAAPAVRQGFFPDTISTDLHRGSMNAGMIDMPTTMSKFLAMGMPLAEVIRASTWSPAQNIQRPELGHLSVGAEADIAVWNLMQGEFGFADASGAALKGRQRLFCEMTLRAGKLVWNWNARGADDYRKLPSDYGVRKGIDHVVRPMP
ncbi:MAG: amidohydrolase/deacetylase family metallohydrolase [Candidatus Solibacter usitatus]|nr:amidohydrolase/deacetylase family metallohydrolase [Candidatus Solibacter usitatus]